MLGDRAAGAGGDQRRGRGDVEGRGPAAGPGGVDEVVASVSTAAASQRIVRARPTSSGTVSPFARRAIRKAPVCTSLDRPSMISARTAEA